MPMATAKTKKKKGEIARMFEAILRKLSNISKLLKCLIKQHRQAHFCYSIGLAINKMEGGETAMLDLTINNEQKIPVTLHPETLPGHHPAPVDGVPVWSVVSGNATVVPAEDGMSAFLVSSDDPGDTIFMVSADADMGEGVVTISDTITLHTQHAMAANLGLSAGDPVPK